MGWSWVCAALTLVLHCLYSRDDHDFLEDHESLGALDGFDRIDVEGGSLDSVINLEVWKSLVLMFNAILITPSHTLNF